MTKPALATSVTSKIFWMLAWPSCKKHSEPMASSGLVTRVPPPRDPRWSSPFALRAHRLLAHYTRLRPQLLPLHPLLPSGTPPTAHRPPFTFISDCASPPHPAQPFVLQDSSMLNGHDSSTDWEDDLSDLSADSKAPLAAGFWPRRRPIPPLLPAAHPMPLSSPRPSSRDVDTLTTAGGALDLVSEDNPEATVLSDVDDGIITFSDSSEDEVSFVGFP